MYLDGGSLPAGPAPGLLAALLDVPPHELLGVLLKYGVDLIEQVVDVLGDLLVPLGDLRARLGRRALVEFLVPTGLAGLRLTASVTGSHPLPSSNSGGVKNLHRPDDIQLEVMASNRSFALGQRSKSAPTCALV